MPFKDYYTTLEVPSTASAEEIRRSFHRLALKYHPDRNAGSVEAEDRFKQINEAYQVLSDPQKRSRYDALYRDHYPAPPSRPAAERPSDNPEGKGGYNPDSWVNPTDKNPYDYVFNNNRYDERPDSSPPAPSSPPSGSIEDLIRISGNILLFLIFFLVVISSCSR